MTTPAPSTLNELFLGAIERFRGRPVAMRVKVEGTWQGTSYSAFLDQVRETSAGLQRLGVRRGDRVAILSENRPEWAVTDYATLALGAADVPIYPTLPARQVAYILRDSGARVALASSRAQLQKLLEVREACPELEHLVAFEDPGEGVDAMAFAALRAEGRAAPDPAWEATARKVTSHDLATLIYTSGTTGDPKGVMLTHGNITSNVVSALSRISVTGDDECLSFLPLSHIFERMAGHYLMLHGGAIITYASGIDTVSADMLEIRPTVMCSVPRLYEKIYARVLENAASGSAATRRIFGWARAAGERWADATLAGRGVPAGTSLAHRVADRLVFAKLRERTGGRLRFFVSGGAPLSPEINRFFYAAGLPILEGYGLTETSPVITVNTFRDFRIGSVGKPLPGVEVRIADDGEILTRGPHVMRGYFGKPEATREALTADGWFHTGDIGEIDPEGYLRITDRKKDLIVTAGGKNIAPQPIENMAKTSRWVVNAVMLGDRRRFPIMLVVPNLPALQEWARAEGLQMGDEALLAHPAALEKMEREVRQTLRDLARFEIPKRYVLLGRDFSIEAGEMTPTLKVKRRVVEERYRELIEAVYDAAPGDAS
jgi:long-chain acyl-CoA synthetase